MSDRIAAAIRGADDPVWWIEKFLGFKLTALQAAIARSVWANPNTAVAACHAVGKSHIVAAVAIAFSQIFPNSIVCFSAPTYRQIKEVIWSKIKAMRAAAPYGLFGVDHTVPKWDISDEWMMLGFSPQHPEKAQGLHAPYVLLILDEASGINDKVLEAMKGFLASGYMCRLLLLGNPTRPEGALFDAFNGKRHIFETFQVSCWDTPNLLPCRDAALSAPTNEARWRILRACKPKFPYLITPSFVADMEEEYGVDSDFYRVRCLGQFPLGGDDQLVPLHRVMESVHRWEDIDDSARWWRHREKFYGHPVGALDVARFGSNESVFCPRLDTVVAPLQCWTGLTAPDLAGRYCEAYQKLLCSVGIVDEDGMGGAHLDIIRDRVPSVMGFRGGMTDGVDTERFGNRRAQAWFGLAERFERGLIAIPRDEKLIGQVSGVRYKYRPNGQKLIESKDDMVKRGVKSPDRGDALTMAFDPATVVMDLGAALNRPATTKSQTLNL